MPCPPSCPNTLRATVEFLCGRSRRSTKTNSAETQHPPSHGQRSIPIASAHTTFSRATQADPTCTQAPSAGRSINQSSLPVSFIPPPVSLGNGAKIGKIRNLHGGGPLSSHPPVPPWAEHLTRRFFGVALSATNSKEFTAWFCQGDQCHPSCSTGDTTCRDRACHAKCGPEGQEGEPLKAVKMCFRSLPDKGKSGGPDGGGGAQGPVEQPDKDVEVETMDATFQEIWKKLDSEAKTHLLEKITADIAQLTANAGVTSVWWQ